jgi:DNA-binding response OmpR family regulator
MRILIVELEYMMRNPGQILTKTMILDRVWGYDFDTQSNNIEVHVIRKRYLKNSLGLKFTV